MMEVTEKILSENSAAIQARVTTIVSLLPNIVQMNAQNVALLKNNEAKVSQNSRLCEFINHSQCKILCTLNTVIINVEELLLSNNTPCHSDFRINEPLQMLSKESHLINHEPPLKILPEAPERTKELPQETNEAQQETSDSQQEPEEPTQEIKEEKSVEIMETLCFRDEQEQKTAVGNFKLSGRRTKTGKNSLEQVYNCYDVLDVFPALGSSCVIAHVESPSEFYIYLLDDDVVHIDEISNILSQAYSHTECSYRSKKEMWRDLDKFCAVYVDKFKQWYRAEVLDWLLNDETNEKVLVQLIDYGPVYDIPYRSLRPMLKHVYSYPRLAQRCHFHCLCPPDQEKRQRDSYEWPVVSIETLVEILGPMLSVPFEIIFIKPCANSLGLDLAKDVDESSVSVQLMEADVARVILDEQTHCNSFAASQIAEAQNVCVLPTMSDSEKLDRFFDAALPLETTEDINEAVGGYSPQDEKRICKFQDKCRKRNCRFEHVPLTKGLTKDRVTVWTTAASELALPRGGDRVVLKITYAKTACEYYAHISPFPNDLVYAQFMQLDDTLNNEKTISDYRRHRILPAINEIVLVKNWDTRWCRARVLSVAETSMEVFIVDFGDVVNVDVAVVRQIEEEYLQVPFMAVHCRLFNATVDESVSDEQGREFIESRYMCNNYNAEIISANIGHLELLIFDDKGEDLGEVLINKGFAVLRSDEYIPRESECLLVD